MLPPFVFYMISLNANNTTDTIIVTLNEAKTIAEPYYLFEFKCTSTKQVVYWVVNSADDGSNYPLRFNQFEIPTSSLFGTFEGEKWQYRVYEQASPTNTDITGLNLVENGKMQLTKAAKYAFNSTNETVKYNY